MKVRPLISLVLLVGWLVFLTSCNDDNDKMPIGANPDTAPKVSIDRFSEDAGTLMVRNGTNGLPDANAAINFDAAESPFITKGLGPDGELVEYYNFDIKSTVPAPIYVLFRSGDSNPVEGQLNIIDVIPGDNGYNDFWQVYKVTVPSDYVKNVVTSYQDIASAGYPVEEMDIVVNCPVVPEGSTASKRLEGGDAGLSRGWYKDQIVFYFNFNEKELMVNGSGSVPLSPIYVTFNINPNEPGGGPSSGFKMETGTRQTHNVVATLPSDSQYSPLWFVNAYNNSDFDDVSDLMSAEESDILGEGVAMVNCPIVSVTE